MRKTEAVITIGDGKTTGQPPRARGGSSEAVHTGERTVAPVFVIGESVAGHVPDWTAETTAERIMSEIGAVLDGGRQTVATGAAHEAESPTGETTPDGLEAVHAPHEMAVTEAALHALELIAGIVRGLACGQQIGIGESEAAPARVSDGKLKQIRPPVPPPHKFPRALILPSPRTLPLLLSLLHE